MTCLIVLFSFTLLRWHGPAQYAKRVHPLKLHTRACSCLGQRTCRRSKRRSVRLAVRGQLLMSHRTVSLVDSWRRLSDHACERAKISYWRINHVCNTRSIKRSRTVCLANTCFGSSYVKLPESTAVRTNRGFWLIEVRTCMLEISKCMFCFFIVTWRVSPGWTCNASVLSARTYICVVPYIFCCMILGRSVLRIRINKLPCDVQDARKLLQSRLSKRNACNSVMFCRWGMYRNRLYALYTVFFYVFIAYDQNHVHVYGGDAQNVTL